LPACFVIKIGDKQQEEKNSKLNFDGDINKALARLVDDALLDQELSK
jgi:hypothetical protein